MRTVLQLSDENRCSSSTHFTVNVGDHAVNLASRQLLTADCASSPPHTSHWTLESQPGRRLSVSLVDFSHSQMTQPLQRCSIDYFAKLTDLTNHKTTALCHNGLKHRNLTTTAGHRVTLQIPKRSLLQSNFIISFKGKQ